MARKADKDKSGSFLEHIRKHRKSPHEADKKLRKAAHKTARK